MAWETMGIKEFSERGPNFLNYVQHFFPERRKFFYGVIRPPVPRWLWAWQK